MVSPDVEDWFARYDNPKRDVVMRVRLIVLDADERIAEKIKWNTPTFQYKGDMASFFPLSMDHATLVFHQGRHIPGTYKHLVPDGDHAAVFRVTSFEEAEERREELERIVGAWIQWRDLHT